MPNPAIKLYVQDKPKEMQELLAWIYVALVSSTFEFEVEI